MREINPFLFWLFETFTLLGSNFICFAHINDGKLLKFSFIFFYTDSLCKSNEDAALREISIQNKNKMQCTAYIGTVAGQRGNPKLVLNGYAYIPNKRIKEKTYWNCSHVRQKKCKARLITVGSMDNIVVTFSQHTHEQEFSV